MNYEFTFFSLRIAYYNEWQNLVDGQYIIFKNRTIYGQLNIDKPS